MSLYPTDMQSSDVSTNNVVSAQLNGNIDVRGTKTLSELSSKNSDKFTSSFHEPEGGNEEGALEGQEEVAYMVVEFVENSGSRTGLEGPDHLVDGSERGSVNVEGNSVADSDWGMVLGEGMGGGEVRTVEEGSRACDGENLKGFRTNVGDVENVIDQDSSGKVSFNSFAKQLVHKPVDNDICGKEVKEAGTDGSLCYREETMDGSFPEVNHLSSEVKAAVIGTEAAMGTKNSGVIVAEGILSESKGELGNQAVRSVKVAAKTNKVITGVHVNEGAHSDPKGVTLVDTDACVRSDGKKGKKKGGFFVSDLVWGKVRSHPWWPAQIIEPGDASDQARKYLRSKSYLLAYFGDQTFAWNDEAKVKPFAPHFSQMVKQSTMEAFRHAVSCILDEAARRVEFGLSCHCITGDVYSRLKTQVINNAGIREKSSIQEGGDRFNSASSFEPENFLDYVKHLAQEPHVQEVDRLEHVISQAQTSAFYRWKGCYNLAEFGPLIGYINNEADALASREKEETENMIDDVTVVPQEKVKEHNNGSQKRKKVSIDSGRSTKKLGCVSNLKGKKVSPKQDDGEEAEAKTDRKSISFSGGRRKEAKLPCSELQTNQSRPLGMSSRDLKPSFRVGESILRVAGKLSHPSPILKLDVSSQGRTSKANKSKHSRGQMKANPLEKASPDVICSQLLLAAVQPLKEHNLLSTMITFVSDYRNSVVPDSELMQKLKETASEDTNCKSEERSSSSESDEMAEGFPGSKSKEMASDSEITTTLGCEAVEDACCADKIIRVPEPQTSLSDEKMAEPESDGISAALLQMDDMLSASQQHNGSENAASETDQFDEELHKEESPTALTLKFTDMDSIPTEAKLNKIFSAFGPLKESETEVLAKKNCARVVFKRSLDAETAFSSSGKFEIFGASLVCYRLNYAPSPRKSSSGEAKRRRKDETPLERTGA